ncbi:hypothetical protein [Aeromonas rivuli]|nr:hypothetical protein [Aeromonas rivuli]UBO75274.1 hypothetical protein KYK33_07025 [Aeromonas rivuli]
MGAWRQAQEGGNFIDFVHGRGSDLAPLSARSGLNAVLAEAMAPLG